MAQGSRLRSAMKLGENGVRTAASLAERTPWVSDRERDADGEASGPRTEASRAESTPWFDFPGGNGDRDGGPGRRPLPRFELPPPEEVDVDERPEPPPERHFTAPMDTERFVALRRLTQRPRPQRKAKEQPQRQQGRRHSTALVPVRRPHAPLDGPGPEAPPA